MVKILGISGSPRKSGTEYALKVALKAAEEVGGVETKSVTLRGKKIMPCLHCDRCNREGTMTCPPHAGDGMDEIYPLFAEADAYIFASPVYQMNMSGQLLTCLNRLRPLWPLIKDGMLKTRVGGAIVVGGTRHGGLEPALMAINNFYNCFGIIAVTGGHEAYCGGTVWSQDRKTEGVKDDEVGLQTVRVMGRRVAEVASLIVAGKKALGR